MSERKWQSLPDDIYEVQIDSEFKKGSLAYGELFLPGERKEEILFSTYVCHPSLCNDNLSGPAVITALAQIMSGLPRKYSYRFLFLPETIGSITWLSKNKSVLPRIAGGLVALCLGDRGTITYKRSRQGATLIDRAVEKALLDSGTAHTVLDFYPTGSDERQYDSPGFNLPVGSLMRTIPGHFPEYHTSADNVTFMSPQDLADSLEKYLAVCALLEENETYINQKPEGEPQLGKYNLYHSHGGPWKRSTIELAMLWTLNFSDGKNSLLDIANRSNMKFSDIREATSLLAEQGLLRVQLRKKTT